MLKIKKIIKNFIDDFMLDPIYNIIMYGMCSLFILITILLTIYISKELIELCLK